MLRLSPYFSKVSATDDPNPSADRAYNPSLALILLLKRTPDLFMILFLILILPLCLEGAMSKPAPLETREALVNKIPEVCDNSEHLKARITCVDSAVRFRSFNVVYDLIPFAP